MDRDGQQLRDYVGKSVIDCNERRLTTDTQRVEIAVLKTQVEHFKIQLDELEAWLIGQYTLLRQRDAETKSQIQQIATQVADISLNMRKSGPPILTTQIEPASIRRQAYERGSNCNAATLPDETLTERLRKLHDRASQVFTRPLSTCATLR
jgi:hypothetical protein